MERRQLKDLLSPEQLVQLARLREALVPEVPAAFPDVQNLHMRDSTQLELKLNYG